MTIWTIGHSNRSIETFISILQSFNIKVLADIRSMPGSRKWPHFDQHALDLTLREVGIQYVHIPALGGRRKAKADSHNTGWNNKSFMGYADYMETEEFKKGIEYLEEIAVKEPTAYMCSEAVWWRCHRSLVSDYLKVKGWTVMHIMELGKASEHPYTSVAKPVQGNLFYNKD